MALGRDSNAWNPQTTPYLPPLPDRYGCPVSGVLQDVAILVGRRNAVFGVLEDANGHDAAVEGDVGDVDVAVALACVGQIRTVDATFEVEHDRRTWCEDDHGDLVAVAIIDVALHAVVDRGQHTVLVHFHP